MMIWSIDPNWIIKKGAGVVRFFPLMFGDDVNRKNGKH